MTAGNGASQFHNNQSSPPGFPEVGERRSRLKKWRTMFSCVPP